MIALGLKTIEQSVPSVQTNGYSHHQQPYQVNSVLLYFFQYSFLNLTMFILFQVPHPQQYESEANFQPTYSHLTHTYNQVANNQVSNKPPAARKTSPMFSTPNPIPNSTVPAPVSNYNSTPPSYQYSSPNPATAGYPFAPQTPEPLGNRMPAINPQPPVASFTPPVSAISNPPATFFNPSLGSQFNQYNNTAAMPPSGIPPMHRTSSTPTPPLPSASQVPYSRPITEHVTQSRSKYVVDPSVKGGGYGNTVPSMGPITQQPMNNPAASFAPQNNVNFYQQSNQNTSYPAAPQPNNDTYVRGKFSSAFSNQNTHIVD